MIARIIPVDLCGRSGQGEVLLYGEAWFPSPPRRAHGSRSDWLEVAPANSEACLVLYPRKMMPGSEQMLPSVILYTIDTQRTYEELSAKGVAFSMTPSKMPMGTFAKFKDLDGNEFVLSDVN